MLPTISNKSHLNWAFDILFLTIIIGLFYSFGTGSYPLFTPDEGRYSEVAREMIVTGDYVTPRINGIVFLDKPILFYWLQVCAIKLFGLKEWALRFFPITAAVITCLFSYSTARILYDRRTGLLAVSILATSSLFFTSAHYANLDLEVAFWITSALFAFILAVHTNNPIRKFLFILMYICSAFAFLTKGLIGVVFPFGIAFCWLVLQKRWRIVKEMYLAVGIVIWLALVLPWFILVQKSNPMFFHYYFITQQVTRFLSADVFNNPLPWWFYFPIIAIGFFPWTIFLLQSFKNSITDLFQNDARNLFFLLWIILIFSFFSIPHSKIISYILPILPALSILVANYLNINYEKVSQRTLYFAISNLFFMSIASTALYYFLAYSLGKTILIFAVIINSIYLLGVVTIFFLRHKKSLQPLIFICIATNSLTLFAFVYAAPYLNQNTAKPLVNELKTLLTPQDEVVSYYKYYQDLPLYLERYITVVYNWNDSNILNKDNWARELGIGNNWFPAKHLINEEQFWQRWNSPKKLFVFLNENYLKQFREHTQNYVEIGRSNDIILVSNQR